MILKGSQRANGSDLAIHLVNGFDNEKVELADLRGAVAEDIYGAFAEFEAVAAGTRAQKYLYSLSVSPHEPMTHGQYLEAVALIEDRLGLTGQPRALVFHVKDGREHAHVVWSRIDIDQMKAIHMSHDKSRLMDCAVELAHRFGFELPPGLKAWEEKQSFKKDALEPTLAEKAQAEQTGITPEERRAAITQAYEQADSTEAFRAALSELGYVLAKGDRRGFVIVDRQCDVHSLTRYVKGHKASAIKAKLAGINRDDLPSVDEAKTLVRDQARARDQAEGKGESKGDDGGHSQSDKASLERMRRELEPRLAHRQAQRQTRLNAKEQELYTRQQSERLALHAAQLKEGRGLFFRARRAVASLIEKTPGLRSVLGPLQKATGLDPQERHRIEREALSRRHAREKEDAKRHVRMAARQDTRERQSLERKIARAERAAMDAARAMREDFAAASRDGVRRDASGMAQTESLKGDQARPDLTVSFNDAGEFIEGYEQVLEAEREDELDEQRLSGWKRRMAKRENNHKDTNRRRTRGRGHKRDEDE